MKAIRASEAEQALDRLERLASGGKWKRFWANPNRYLWAQWYRYRLYPKKGPERYTVPVFWGDKMEVLLPASTDIYLLGGKTHPSEIRLARYLWNSLSAGDTFLDVGAHYGYFSLLAAERVTRKGRVLAFEAAPKTYEILERNVRSLPFVDAYALAVAETEGVLTFHEFPNLYGEYNSLDGRQYQGESWYANQKPKKIQVAARPLDAIVEEKNLCPTIIKIDVEGAEDQVVRGAEKLLHRQTPAVIMEFLLEGPSKGHRQAMEHLLDWGYDAYLLEDDGTPRICKNVESALSQRCRFSDNVLFQKSD